MANKKVTIKLRLPTSAGRGWVNPTGIDDPDGTFYLRFYEGALMKNVRVEGDYHDAEREQLKLEQKLDAHSRGYLVPEDITEDTKKFNLSTDAVAAYIKLLRDTTKRNGRRYAPQALAIREAELKVFLAFVKRTYIEQITAEDLTRYKNSLTTIKPTSVLNKMGIILSWLKRNPLVSRVGLMPASALPEPTKTKAHPFTDDEVRRMLEVTKTRSEALLIKLLFASGLRRGEVGHLEFSDLDEVAGCVHVRSKPHLGWETKTTSSVRAIPVDPDLIRDIQTLGTSGLVFDFNVAYALKNIGIAAGVKPPVGERACWCHRWRDSYATDLVREREHTDREIAEYLGHRDTSMLAVYVAAARMDDPRTRASAKNSNRFSAPRLKVVNG
jgi:integrase